MGVSKRPKESNRPPLTLLSFIMIGFLFYWGYCWGWWGSESIFLAYLFQCKCPGVSADHRFGDEFDILVSSCYESRVKDVSPDGKLVLVGFIGDDKKPFEVFDLENDVAYQGKDYDISEGFFISDEKLVVVSTRSREAYIYNIKTQSKFNLRWSENLVAEKSNRDRERDGKLEEHLFNELDKYDQFIFSDECILAYASESYNGSFVLCKNHTGISYIPWSGEWHWEDFVSYVESDVNNSVAHLRIQCDQHDGSCRSYGGEYVEFWHRITTSDGKQIAESNFPWDDWFVHYDWVFDNRGYLMGGGTSFVFEGFLLNFGEVGKPIVIRILPDEYQSPASLERIEAKRAEEQMQQLFALSIAIGVIVIGVVIMLRIRKRSKIDIQ